MLSVAGLKLGKKMPQGGAVGRMGVVRMGGRQEDGEEEGVLN